MDRTPRILTINRVGFLGGAERIILSIGTAALRQGFAFTLACPAGELSAAAVRVGIDVAPLDIDRSKRTWSPFGLARLVTAMVRGRRTITSLAREIGAGVLHAHHPIGALYAAQAARELGLPLILHVHETLPAGRAYAFALRRAMPFCRRFVCVSRASAELMHAMGAPASMVQLLYNGADRSFAEAATPASALTGPGPHIGHFGVLEPRKGQDIFVQAAAMLLPAHPAAQFWIVGSLSFADNHQYLDRLRQAIASSALSGRIHLVGHQSDVAAWMAGMSVVVLASREKESLPTVLIEGATAGRALVATDVGGVREIIEDGRTGLVVPPGDPAALAAAIGRALGPDGAAFGRAAAEAAACRFGAARFADAIGALYRDMLPQPCEAAS